MTALRARSIALALAAAAFWYAVTSFDETGRDLAAWPFLAASLLLSIAWQWRLGSQRPAVTPAGALPAPPFRKWAGGGLAMVGFALFLWASYALHRDWQASFDAAWLTWIAAATAMAVGLDLAWGRWPRPSGLWSGSDAAIALAIFTIGAALRGYGLIELPGPYHVTQLEEAQIGNFGWAYLAGSRLRWEFLSHMWLSALGQALFGSSDLLPVRIPFAAVSSLKVIPLYFFLLWVVGRPGAVAGAGLLACSGWDVMLSRIPTNQNELTAAVCFAVLAGPARRGRPSAYVFLGFVAGYLTYEYIAYRPLALFVLGAAAWLSLKESSASWAWRLSRPGLVLLMAVVMAAPLFTSKLGNQIGFRYLDGWNRARGSDYYRKADDWRATLDMRLQRSRTAFGALFFRGDPSPHRNVRGRPALDRLTAAFLVAGVAFALTHWMSGLVPLTLLAFLVTFTGTLIATGQFYMGRAGCTVVYTHALVGFGAAGLSALLSALLERRRWRRSAVYALLATCVAAAAVANLRFLTEYWRSPSVLQALHYELAYQTHWLSRMVRPGERVVGLSSRIANVLLGSDAAWMRAEHVAGDVFVDLWLMVEELQKHDGEPLFVYVAAENGGGDVVAVLETIWPELHFEAVAHPVQGQAGAYYYARAAARRPPLSQSPGLADVRCRSARGSFGIHLQSGERRQVESLLPFVDRSTWPQELRMVVRRERVAELTLDASIRFAVEEPGTYAFRALPRHGRAALAIAGREAPGGLEIELPSGVHELHLSGSFAPLSAEPQLRLEWRGPDTGGRFELMPIHRIAPPGAGCAGAVAPAQRPE
jgi:hypothetical protein